MGLLLSEPCNIWVRAAQSVDFCLFFTSLRRAGSLRLWQSPQPAEGWSKRHGIDAVAVLRRTLPFLEVFILAPGTCFLPSPPLHHFCSCFCLWVWVLFTSALSNVAWRCLLEIRILLRVTKLGFVNGWKKPVPLQIVTLSYGTKCLTLLIVDMVRNSLV